MMVNFLFMDFILIVIFHAVIPLFSMSAQGIVATRFSDRLAQGFAKNRLAKGFASFLFCERPLVRAAARLRSVSVVDLRKATEMNT